MKLKKLIKNKKSQEGAGSMTFGEIIGWIILAALVIFIIFWYSGLSNQITQLLKSIF